MNVTIYDISKRLGISASTVSRALSGSHRVNHKTRERVLAAAREMGYRPNHMARNLRTGQSNMIAFITDNLSSPLVSAMAAGAEGWLRERGWTLFVADGGIDFVEASSFLSTFDRNQIAGLLLAGSWIHTFDDAWIGEIPTVCAFCVPESGRWPAILTDDTSGAYAATTHLLERGYRRVALINGPSHWYAAQMRLEGYRRAIEEAGLTFDPALVRNGDWRPESGYQEARRLLRQGKPDAIFVANDFMAVGALRAAEEASLKVPEELGIIGFDNREVTQITRPKLSSVVLPMSEVGRAAAEALFALIGTPEEERVAADRGQKELRVGCTLVVRQSSATDVDVEEEEFPFY